MLNNKNVQLGKVRSTIRELFEYGKKRKAEIGNENVYDFSIGNPNVPVPEEVTAAMHDILETTDPVALHGYTSAQGDLAVRNKLAQYSNERFSTNLNGDCFYLTCGAAASLTITLNAIVNAGDEVIVIAPFFPEYRVFAENAGAKLIVVNAQRNTFALDLNAISAAITDKTKAIIINSPNNPTGVVYSEEQIIGLAKLLESRSQKGTIYLIADEPYRELVFDSDVKVPYVMNYYKNSLVCYSYSKSLSLPGERIGYIAVNNCADDFTDLYAAVCGAGRALGFVCAPNFFQQLIGRVYDKTSDVSIYKNNRDKLYAALREYGYEVVKPDGAFYLYVKALEPDAKAFAERAKKYELLIVAGDDFGGKGYVRISYCVAPDVIERALPSFKALAQSYKN